MLKIVPFPADQHRFFSHNIFDRDLDFLENRTRDSVPEFYKLLQEAKTNNKLRLLFLSILSKDADALIFQEKYQKRVAYEIFEMLQHKDNYMLDYLLIHEDMAHFLENKNKIAFIGRGSATSSVVLFLLGITKIDPLVYNLLFERWYIKDRTPDIDLDLGKTESVELKEYLKLKYGVYFKQVKVRLKWRVKTIFKEVLLHQGFNSQQIQNFIERITEFERLLLAFDEYQIIEFMCQHDLAMQTLMEYNPKVKKEVLEKLEEEKAIGNHAAGFILSDMEEPFFEEVETEGVVKIDILNLEAYSEINRRYSLEKFKKLKITPKGLENTLNKLVEPTLMGGSKSYWKSGGYHRDFPENPLPQSIEGMATLLAMFRPGPLQIFFIMKEGKKFPQIEHILQESGGLLIFQEQLMQILHELAGLSYDSALEVLKNLSTKNTRIKKEKKHPENLEEVKQKLGEDLFNFCAVSAPILFNKGHGISYATIEYLLCN